jgi:NhaP-type Na+/H+ or K+/H+ antiporter
MQKSHCGANADEVRWYNIVLYQIALSCLLGAVIGWVARKTLRFAEERKWVLRCAGVTVS